MKNATHDEKSQGESSKAIVDRVGSIPAVATKTKCLQCWGSGHCADDHEVCTACWGTGAIRVVCTLDGLSPDHYVTPSGRVTTDLSQADSYQSAGEDRPTVRVPAPRKAVKS